MDIFLGGPIEPPPPGYAPVQHTSLTCLVLLYVFILTLNAWLKFSESEAAYMVSAVKC